MTRQTTWCQTCGTEVGGDGDKRQCGCWCLLADALQQFLGMDFDGAAQMAADLWQAEADKEYVWAATYAEDHLQGGQPIKTYPDERGFAPAEVREQDARNFPHDEPCPKCGRRQWGLGKDVTDPVNPTDAEQETCGACGTSFSGEQA